MLCTCIGSTKLRARTLYHTFLEVRELFQCLSLNTATLAIERSNIRHNYRKAHDHHTPQQTQGTYTARFSTLLCLTHHVKIRDKLPALSVRLTDSHSIEVRREGTLPVLLPRAACQWGRESSSVWSSPDQTQSYWDPRSPECWPTPAWEGREGGR